MGYEIIGFLQDISAQAHLSLRLPIIISQIKLFSHYLQLVQKMHIQHACKSVFRLGVLVANPAHRAVGAASATGSLALFLIFDHFNNHKNNNCNQKSRNQNSSEHI